MLKKINEKLEIALNESLNLLENLYNEKIKKYELKVTQGSASKIDKDNFYKKSKNSSSYFRLENDSYELWLNGDIIGGCNLKIAILNVNEYTKNLEDFSEEEIQDLINEESKTLFVDTFLDNVYILEKYQGIGLGLLFADVIRQILFESIIEKVKQFNKEKVNKIMINAYAEYHSDGGQMVHQVIHNDCDDLLKQIMKDIYNIKVEFEMDAGF